MAHRSDLAQEVLTVADEANTSERDPRNHRQTEDKARRAQALSLRLSGFSWEEIGRHLNITAGGARSLVERTMDAATGRQVEEMRSIENARLDKAQQAIWQRVLQGDDYAIDRFLKISQQRARINGLNAPMKVDLNVSVKHEMEQALGQLESMVLENETRRLSRAEQEDIMDAEVIERDEESA